MVAFAGISVFIAARFVCDFANLFAKRKRINSLNLFFMVQHPGQTLQALRIRLGQKAKDVAPQLGISPSYYSEIERGKKPFPSDTSFILALCSALGVADFIFDSGNEITNRPLTSEEKSSLGNYIELKGAEFFLVRLLSRVEKSGLSVLMSPQDEPPSGLAEEAIISETESGLNKRLNDLESSARYFFSDVSEIIRLSERITVPDQSGDLAMLRTIAKTVKRIQPGIEKGLSRLIKEKRAGRRSCKPKKSKQSD